MTKLIKCFVGVVLNNLFIMQSFQTVFQKYFIQLVVHGKGLNLPNFVMSWGSLETTILN